MYVQCLFVRHFLVSIRSNLAQPSFYTHALITPTTLCDIEAEVEFYEIPPHGGFAEVSLLYQHVSKCHSHFLPEPIAILSLLQHMSVLTFMKLASVSSPSSCSKQNALHTHTILEIKMCLRTPLHTVLYPSTSCCWPEMAVWEDLVSVWLRQLSFNERLRSVQVPAGQ